MGGVRNNENFILNCSGWKNIPSGPYKADSFSVRLAPMTGAVENIGYPDERQFYFDLISGCKKAGIKLSIGDGTPDSKLKWGIEAVKSADTTAAVFIKPYSNKKICERFEWAEEIAECCGIDIDSYNIATMRNSVQLEKKDRAALMELKNFFSRKNIPFAIKGIFTQSDIELAKEIKPDIAFVSNHGGRVETDSGSTAEFLRKNYRALLSNCGQLWVDGGIRSKADCEKAGSYGVCEVLIGRPFASAVCRKKSFAVL